MVDESIQEIQSEIDRVGRLASWNNPNIKTWDDVFNSPDVRIMKVKASWWAFDKTEKEIVDEAKRRYLEEMENR